MFNSFFETLTYCLASGALGVVLAVLIGRLGQRKEVEPPSSDFVPEEPSPSEQPNVDLFVNALYELTSQVDLQVGQHTDRVCEITDKLEVPGNVGSAMIAVAGKMLISANQQLQKDLVEAKQEVQRQRELMTSCMQESRTDALTNIANRRGLDHELTRVFAQRRRNGATFSLLIIDIDHFKRVNDKYGHMVGDQLLKCFSRCLVETFRESDFVARFGGEEFVAILPQTPLIDACRCAERVRNIVANSLHKVGDLDIQITTSIGVKEVEDNETDSDLLQRADKALYAAKNGGRNCSYYHDGTQCHRLVPEVGSEKDEEQDPVDVAFEMINAAPESSCKIPALDSAIS